MVVTIFKSLNLYFKQVLIQLLVAANKKKLILLENSLKTLHVSMKHANLQITFETPLRYLWNLIWQREGFQKDLPFLEALMTYKRTLLSIQLGFIKYILLGRAYTWVVDIGCVDNSSIHTSCTLLFVTHIKLYLPTVRYSFLY